MQNLSKSRLIENKKKQEKTYIVQLSTLGKGQAFGEEDIVRNTERKYNAICYSNKVTVYHISKHVQ